MPDKPRAAQNTKRRTGAAKQPRKRSPKDHASQPQRPITLKADVTLPPALQNGARSAERPPPTPVKKKAAGKTSSRSSRLFPEISREAEAIAVAAAAREGVSPKTWLENLIHQTTQERPEAFDDLVESLQRIEQRLSRLEDQRGFWSRFWEQFMEPKR